MTGAAPAGPAIRHKHRDRQRRRIARAALELFLRDGFDATSVDAVAAAAGVSRRTFFRYFESKEEAFFADQTGRLDALVAILQQPHSGERPFDTVRRALFALADGYARDRERVIAQHRAIQASRSLAGWDQQLDRRWEAALAEVLCAGRVPGTRDHRAGRYLAGAVLGVARTVLRSWMEGAGEADLGAMGREALALLEPLDPLQPLSGTPGSSAGSP